MPSFPWIPIYKELAKALLEYRNRQDELLSIVREAAEQGCKVVPLKDKDTSGNAVPLAVIDPFTFFACFNRTSNYADRNSVLKIVADRLNLSSDVPKTFDGIPIANAQQSWFFPYQTSGRENDIAALWDMAEGAVHLDSLDEFPGEVFDRCLKINSVGAAKLSMGLFWLNAHRFLPLDSNTRAFLKKYGIQARIRSGKDYVSVLNSAHELLEEDFPNVSHTAYLEARAAAATKKKEEGRPKLNLELLADAVEKTMRPILVDRGGLNDESKEGYQHQKVIPRASEHLSRASIEADPIGAVQRAISGHVNLLHPIEATQAVDHVTAEDPEIVAERVLDLLYGSDDLGDRLEGFLEWSSPRNLADGKTASINGTVASYLLAVVSPKEHAFCKPDTYTKAVKALLGSEAVRKDAAERILHANVFYEDALDVLCNRFGLPFSDLMHVHIAFYLMQSNDAGLPTWMDLMTSEKPDAGVAEPAAEYSVRDAVEDLFVPAETFQYWLDVIRAKKNAILEGPPGVGKTFVAKRLAFALMGRRDTDRLGMVQFHQSYSYEDFIQGYRPSDSGLFELRNGTFYQFCEKAAQDPERPYLFIIDEINRGNLSKIFGELMMLIEPDKRGPDWAIPLTYSDDGAYAVTPGTEIGPAHFFVPENVHLIGMMNTADRSLAMVDYALRRRFAFIRLEPRFEDARFAAHLRKRGADEIIVSMIIDRMQEVNGRIRDDTSNLGTGFCIGHSYFCPGPGEDVPDASWYLRVIDLEIAPLLHEYWFDKPDRADEHIRLLKKDVSSI